MRVDENKIRMGHEVWIDKKGSSKIVFETTPIIGEGRDEKNQGNWERADVEKQENQTEYGVLVKKLKFAKSTVL